MQPGKANLDTQISLTGKEVIHSLNGKGFYIVPAAIGPHGKWGPIFDSLIIVYRTITPHIFNQENQALATIYERSTSHPCPMGIVQQAKIKWRVTKPNTFYGGSYSAPTPMNDFSKKLASSSPKLSPCTYGVCILTSGAGQHALMTRS